MSINKYSITELESELARKKQEEVPKLRDKDTLEKDAFDFAMSFHEWYTKSIAKDGCEPKDGRHYAYEMLIEFLYDSGYWNWLNKIL